MPASACSFVRLSAHQQRKGDSLRRQLAASTRHVTENGWVGEGTLAFSISVSGGPEQDRDRHRSEPHFATTRTHPLDPEVTFALGGSGRPMFKVTGTAWLYRAGSSDRRNGVDRRVSYD